MEIFTPATPDQGLTALVYIGSALLGTLLFLKGMYAVAFLTAIGATNLARVWLELLRADYRCHGPFSAYPVRALISVVYSLSISLLSFPTIPPSPPSSL